MTSLLAMCTPPGLVPIFLSYTSDMTERERRRTAWTVTFTVFLTLVITIFAGDPVFHALGIDVANFRVGGGILILLSAIKIVTGEPEEPNDKKPNPDAHKNPGVVPLGIPIVAGPGLITAMIIQSQEYDGLTDDLILVAGVATLCLYLVTCLLLGERLTRVVGPSGLEILSKIMGLLLTAIAVNFIVTGLVQSIPALQHHG